MKRLRVGIIGCGSIAATHAWAIEQNDGAVLTALCDTETSRIMELNRGRDCLLFNDWTELVASPGVDAVAVCLPHYLHAQATIDALEAGKHVICEKPLCVSLSQLDEMKRAAAEAERRGTWAFGIFQHRFSRLIQEIRGMIAGNALGRLRSGRIFFRCTRNSDYYGGDAWRGRWLEGSLGTLTIQGSEDFDSSLPLATWQEPRTIDFTGEING